MIILIAMALSGCTSTVSIHADPKEANGTLEVTSQSSLDGGTDTSTDGEPDTGSPDTDGSQPDTQAAPYSWTSLGTVQTWAAIGTCSSPTNPAGPVSLSCDIGSVGTVVDLVVGGELQGTGWSASDWSPPLQGTGSGNAQGSWIQVDGATLWLDGGTGCGDDSIVESLAERLQCGPVGQ